MKTLIIIALVMIATVCGVLGGLALFFDLAWFYGKPVFYKCLAAVIASIAVIVFVAVKM